MLFCHEQLILNVPDIDGYGTLIGKGSGGLDQKGAIECVPYPLAGRRHHDNAQTNKPSHA